MNDGWLKIHRKMLDNPFCFQNAARTGFWVILLSLASHEDKDFFLGNQKIRLKAGQFVTGRKKLSKTLGVSEMMCERWLSCLENAQQIEQQKTNKYRLITVKNWDKYQTNAQQNAQQMHNRCTTDEQQMNTIKNLRIKELYIADTSAQDFSFPQKLEAMKTAKDKRMTIIASYWITKGLNFENEKTYSSALRRELRPAGNLIGYEAEKIVKTMEWLKSNADYKWTLETVHKYIDEQGAKPEKLNSDIFF